MLGSIENKKLQLFVLVLENFEFLNLMCPMHIYGINLGFRFKLKSKLLFPIHFLAVKLDMDTDAEIKKFTILIHIVTWT